MTFAVCFIVGGLAWVIWHFFHLQLTYILSRIRIGELYLDYWLFGDDKTSVTSWGAESVGSWRKYLPKMAIPDISVDVLKRTTVVAVQPLRVVFRDNGFVSDAVKINVEQIFRQLSPTTDVKSI